MKKYFIVICLFAINKIGFAQQKKIKFYAGANYGLAKPYFLESNIMVGRHSDLGVGSVFVEVQKNIVNNQNISAKLNIPIFGSKATYYYTAYVPRYDFKLIHYNPRFFADLHLTYGFNIFGNNCCCNDKLKNSNYLTASLGAVLSFYKTPRNIKMETETNNATKIEKIKVNSVPFKNTGVSFHPSSVNIGASVALDYHIVNKNNGKEIVAINFSINKYFGNHIVIMNTSLGTANYPDKPTATPKMALVALGFKMPIFK